MMKKENQMPIMPNGKYYGKPVDQLPISYLEWMMTQKFPQELLEAAQKKLESSDQNHTYINVTRHCIDMFSKRFINLWIEYIINSKTSKYDGLATFVARMAQEAWDKGEDVSKHRHADDGTVKCLNNIQWVYGLNPDYPDYKMVVSVMGM